MNIIPTTATLIEKLKINAKAIKKEGRLTYQQALEFEAVNAGYQSWHHVLWCYDQSQGEQILKCKTYMDYLATKAQGAKVERFPSKGDVFHAVEIDGEYFYAAVSADPFVARNDKRIRGHEMGWVQLGNAACIMLASDRFSDSVSSWAVCKYDSSQSRIPLGDLSLSARYAVAYEFGIEIDYHDEDLSEVEREFVRSLDKGGSHYFYKSPSFQSLCEYARAHPRVASKWGVGNYLGDWGSAARG